MGNLIFNNEKSGIGNWKSIYVMKSNNGKVKIGVSKCPDKRKKVFESLLNIQILEKYETALCSNSYQIESVMHKYFSDYRIYGEWFSCEYEIAVSVLANKFKEMAEFEKHTIGRTILDYFMEDTNRIISSNKEYVKLLEYNVEKLSEALVLREEANEKLFQITEHLLNCLYSNCLEEDNEEKSIQDVYATITKKSESVNDDELAGIEEHIEKKVDLILGGKESGAYRDTKIRSMVYRDIYSQIKREFNIYDDSGKPKSYKALKRKYLADAHDLIDCYEPPRYLEEMIEDINLQISFDKIG